MRTYIYFSSKARTSGNFRTDELMKAGRMDIVCNFVIHGFFISNAMREDVELHLVFYGAPDPPKHIMIRSNEIDKEIISKKDIAGLIKRILFKYKDGEKIEAFSGCYVEKKSFLNVVADLKKDGKEILILDKKGKDIRKIKDEKLKNAVFVFGDHDGLPSKELRRLKKESELVSVGKKTYFASQTLMVVQNELDLRAY